MNIYFEADGKSEQSFWIDIIIKASQNSCARHDGFLSSDA